MQLHQVWTQELLQDKLQLQEMQEPQLQEMQEPQLQEEQGEIWEIRWMTATRAVKTS